MLCEARDVEQLAAVIAKRFIILYRKGGGKRWLLFRVEERRNPNKFCGSKQTLMRNNF